MMTEERERDGQPKGEQSSLDSAGPMSSSTELDDELIQQIAAFLDGRLEGEEREEVAGILRTNRDAYFVFSEVARFRGSESAVQREGKVIPWPKLPPIPTRLAAAASVLFALGIGLFVSLLFAPVTLTVAELVDELENASPQREHGAALWIDGPLVMSFAGAETAGRRAVWLGVNTLDLEVALRSRDQSTVRELSQHLLELSQPLDLSPSNRHGLEGLAEADVGEPGTALRERAMRQVAAVEKQLRRTSDSHLFDAGRLLEATRLAARSKSIGFLLDPKIREGIAQLSDLELGPTAASQRDEVIGLVDGLEEDRPDFATLEVALEDLLLVLS